VRGCEKCNPNERFNEIKICFQARQLGTKQIDEDGLLDLIRTRPGKKSKYEVQAEKTVAKVRNSRCQPSVKNLTILPI
jgi:hypothetical protein